MNLVEARIEGGAARFAGYAMPLAARPELAALEGRSVVLGLRPAAFEDARLARASGWPTIDATAEVVEDLGDAMHVIFAIDAPPVLTEDVTAAAEDEEAGALVHDEGGPRAAFVARVDAASAVTAARARAPRGRPRRPARLRSRDRRLAARGISPAQRLFTPTGVPTGLPLEPRRNARWPRTADTRSPRCSSQPSGSRRTRAASSSPRWTRTRTSTARATCPAPSRCTGRTSCRTRSSATSSTAPASRR